jgi:hypothetical protein
MIYQMRNCEPSIIQFSFSLSPSEGFSLLPSGRLMFGRGLAQESSNASEFLKGSRRKFDNFTFEIDLRLSLGSADDSGDMTG